MILAGLANTKIEAAMQYRLPFVIDDTRARFQTRQRALRHDAMIERAKTLLQRQCASDPVTAFEPMTLEFRAIELASIVAGAIVSAHLYIDSPRLMFSAEFTSG